MYKRQPGSHTSTAPFPVSTSPGEYAVAVGKGGLGVLVHSSIPAPVGPWVPGTAGEDSSFGPITASGGGLGGGETPTNATGNPGGSGGGGTNENNVGGGSPFSPQHYAYNSNSNPTDPTTGYGGGGEGSRLTGGGPGSKGANGANGIVIVWEYK